MSRPRFSPLVALSACCLFAASPGAAEEWAFVETTATAGIAYDHGYDAQDPHDELLMGGGVAAGDYDGDGWTDLYVIRGDRGPNLLLRNLGDGTFDDVATTAGVDLLHQGSGPAFADLDGDGWLDLFVGTAQSDETRFFRNLGDGSFEDASALADLGSFWYTTSASFGDYDRDGDLDLFLGQWNLQPTELVWRNDGGFSFTPATNDVFGAIALETRFTFTPNFTDLDRDGWPDLTIASDFGRSMVLHNNGDGTFADHTDPAVITDEHGMGAAVGDYDNDGDLDWFVTSIHYDGPLDPGTGITGNRMYQNQGDGSFVDVTDAAGVRAGFWGWGACFADFDNDGDLDLFHTNGFRRSGDVDFDDDPSRLFINQGDGSFVEESLVRGLDDRGHGRSPVCFDYDRDGDLDLFVFKNSGDMRLYRNDGGNQLGYLQVALDGGSGNSHGIGALITIETTSGTQVRELRAGSNYLSQNPAIAHFGLGTAPLVEELTVAWPDGSGSTRIGLEVDQRLTIEHGLIFAAGFDGGNLDGWAGSAP